MLRPNKTIQKILISSPSRFVGEYESEGILISHAWLQFDSFSNIETQIGENPFCRNYYTLVIKTSEEDIGRNYNYRYFGEVVCIYLSILFGKRFDNHGCLEENGFFHLPEIITTKPISLFYTGWNNHSPRCDLGIELNFDKVKIIDKLINDDTTGDHFRNVLNTAGNFYLQALRMFDVDPEVGFLNLVNCGEVLSNYFEYPEDILYDQDLKNVISIIESNLEDGKRICKIVKSRLFQIKKKYTITIGNLLNDYFFQNTEAKEYFSLKKDDIEKRIKSTYDLRSMYVHAGVKFGKWLYPHRNFLNEIQIGIPVIKDVKLKEIISLVPTINGFERIIRFCLIRFIHQNGFKIDSNLD